MQSWQLDRKTQAQTSEVLHSLFLHFASWWSVISWRFKWRLISTRSFLLVTTSKALVTTSDALVGAFCIGERSITGSCTLRAPSAFGSHDTCLLLTSLEISADIFTKTVFKSRTFVPVQTCSNLEFKLQWVCWICSTPRNQHTCLHAWPCLVITVNLYSSGFLLFSAPMWEAARAVYRSSRPRYHLLWGPQPCGLWRPWGNA